MTNALARLREAKRLLDPDRQPPAGPGAALVMRSNIELAWAWVADALTDLEPEETTKPEWPRVVQILERPRTRACPHGTKLACAVCGFRQRNRREFYAGTPAVGCSCAKWGGYDSFCAIHGHRLTQPR